MVVLTEKFRFIRDDVFLCPCVDTETEKQWVEILKINLETDEIEFGDSIDCIHTAITDISVEEYDEYMDGDEFQEDLIKKSLEIRSSENLEVINLSPEEKFFALKSWAAGIAEAGKKSFTLQTEIDNALDLAYPMANLLLGFMIRVDPKFIEVFLSKIDRECRYNGERHNPSYIANLLKIFEIIGEEENHDEIQHLYSILFEFDEFRGKFVILRGKKFHGKETLNLRDKNIEDVTEIKGLKNLINLTKLDLSNNKITEIKGLENLINLTELDLSENPITEIKGLENLTNLIYLSFFNVNYIGELTEIKGLENLTKLTKLFLPGNKISDIKGLENLVNLTGLFLGSNQITEIKGLENLVNLTKLNLWSNKITEIQGLENLTNLTELNLGSNQITEINGLEHLVNLKELSLTNNPISKIRGFENHPKLPKLKRHFLKRNMIDFF